MSDGSKKLDDADRQDDLQVRLEQTARSTANGGRKSPSMVLPLEGEKKHVDNHEKDTKPSCSMRHLLPSDEI